MFLVEGHSTIITMSLFPGLFIREREVQPPEMDNGGPIDTTTMRNLLVRTTSEKTLKNLGPMTIQASYDPFVYSQMFLAVGLRQLFTVIFPDGATLAFWGFIDKITPASLKEGDFPLCEVKIIPTHRTNTGAENTFTSVAGISPGLVVR